MPLRLNRGVDWILRSWAVAGPGVFGFPSLSPWPRLVGLVDWWRMVWTGVLLGLKEMAWERGVALCHLKLRVCRLQEVEGASRLGALLQTMFGRRMTNPLVHKGGWACATLIWPKVLLGRPLEQPLPVP